jgi:NADPH-dependent 2,4-dienoyl-CoA reductase/sulfur reductase-like enzyme
VLLAGIFPTGNRCRRLARASPGGSVAVCGAGPAGLMAAHPAPSRGAAKVLVVDRMPERPPGTRGRPARTPRQPRNLSRVTGRSRTRTPVAL